MYDDDIEKVDLLIGSLAEDPRPTGFAFAETSFQIFIVMASRRLHADRQVSRMMADLVIFFFFFFLFHEENMKLLL